MDYRESHKAAGKGIQYSQEFKNKNYRRFMWEREQGILLKILKATSRRKYLDFACGTGRILSFLENYFQSSLGVDVSPSMLSVAEGSVIKSTLIQRDLTMEELGESDFSLITSFRFFLNAEQGLRRSVMSRLSSLLDEDGVLVFNNHMNRWSLHAVLIRAYKFIKLDKRRDFNTLSDAQIRTLAHEAGMVIVKRYHYGFLPILNENTAVPIGIINVFERFFSRIAIFNPFSTYVIYVCKKAEDV
jgi:predicted TPR repeat methyltransferase